MYSVTRSGLSFIRGINGECSRPQTRRLFIARPGTSCAPNILLELFRFSGKLNFKCQSKGLIIPQSLCEYQIRRIEAGTESGLLFAKIFGSSSGHIANRSAFASLK
jgi:hypothetical protein